MPAATQIQHAAQRSPQREGLFLAQQRRENAKRGVEGLDRAIEDASEKLFRAVDRAEEAQKLAANAAAKVAEHLLARAVGLDEAPPLSVQEARAAATAAEDDVQALRGVLAGLEAMVDDRAFALRRAQALVVEATKAVVRNDPRVIALAAEAEETWRRFQRQRSALDLLGLNQARPGGEPEYFRVPVPDRSIELAWKFALEALQNDADAELPV